MRSVLKNSLRVPPRVAATGLKLREPGGLVSNRTSSMARSPETRRPLSTSSFAVVRQREEASSYSHARVTPYVTDLPRLPVPKLHDTLTKFLRTVRPHVTDEEYNVTAELAKDFGKPGGVGETLQKLLEQKAASTENWLADWWLNTAYLEQRGPLLVASSPGILLPQFDFKSRDEQLWAAAGAVAAVVEFLTLVEKEMIPQDMQGKFPLDMSQYSKILSTIRIPGVTRDTLKYYGAQQPTHICVAHKNHFFRVDVFGKNRAPLNQKQIFDQLLDVVDRSQYPTSPLGVLTSDNRSTWGAYYEELKKSPDNEENLEVINACIFLLCLDGPNQRPLSDNAPDQRTMAALQMMHGCGVGVNAGNRWYDKTIQLIVGEEGQIGMTYEHTPAEGPPVAILCDHITTWLEKQRTLGPAADLIQPSPRRLDFVLSESLAHGIAQAGSALERLVDDVEMTTYAFPYYGKNFVKGLGLSPDSYIQMALQLAFFKVHGEPGACYETASTRRFLGGRTETTRSCSVESVAFCQAMEAAGTTNEEKFRLLQTAVNVHKDYVNMAGAGLGVDRHLLGLKLMAVENGLNLHHLFMDAGYVSSSYYRLSTSQVASRYDTVMFFGPYVPDGYGICYNPRNDVINFGMSAYKSCPETYSRGFKSALESSLIQMRETASGQTKAKL